MKCQATTYSYNFCPIFTDIARVLMYSFRDQLQPVLTGFLRFFAVPVRGSCILKLSGTGPVRGPSKKSNRTETGLDFKALRGSAAAADVRNPSEKDKPPGPPASPGIPPAEPYTVFVGDLSCQGGLDCAE